MFYSQYTLYCLYLNDSSSYFCCKTACSVFNFSMGDTSCASMAVVCCSDWNVSAEVFIPCILPWLLFTVCLMILLRQLAMHRRISFHRESVRSTLCGFLKVDFVFPVGPTKFFLNLNPQESYGRIIPDFLHCCFDKVAHSKLFPVLFILRQFYCATCHIYPKKRQTKRLKTFKNMLEASEVALKLARVNML